MRTDLAARPAAWLLGLLLLVAGPTIPASGVPPANRTGAWTWPLSPQPELRKAFDPPERDWLPGHRGVDLAAASGQTVLSPAGGTVNFSGWLVDRYVLTIEHGWLRSSFEPVFSELRAGEPVQQGQIIGTVQTERPVRVEPQPGREPPAADETTNQSGHCSAKGTDCLHWGVRRGKTYLDPLVFIGDRRPSVLLSFEGPLPAARRESNNR